MRSLSAFTAVLLCAAMLVCALALFSSAEEDRVYLGDREDLMLPRDYEDSIGWNTAHSGEKLTVWDLSFEKGLGFHCRQSGLAYVEFDISALGMNYFCATVGVLKDATYYIAEGSISFRVYGDGELLATTPVIKWNKKPAYICVPVTGVKTLRLEEDNAGSWVCDAGIGGDAMLSKTEPEAPEWYTRFDPNNTDKKQEDAMVSGDFAYVSDLYFKTYTGEAECRDRNTAGEMIVDHDGRYYPKGIGFHAGQGYSTYIDVDIEGPGYTKFASYYGISLTLTSYDITMANIRFAVFGDGRKLFESKPVHYGDPMQYVEVNVKGVKTLRLSVSGNPKIDGGWGTFAGALLSKSGEVSDDLFFTDYFDAISVKATEPSTDPATAETASATENAETAPETAPSAEPSPSAKPTGKEKEPDPAPRTPGTAESIFGGILVGALCLGAIVFFFFKKRRRG